MTPSPSSTLPIYKQIAQQLREEILKGTYLVGHNLPTEKQLAEDFNSSRHTIREALRDLRQDGVITSRQGSGSVVCAPPSCQSFTHETSTINEIEQYAHSIIRVLNTSVVDLPAALGRLAPTQEQAGWMLIEGFRYTDSEHDPICTTHAYLHPEFLSIARLFGKRATPLYELIEDNFGVVIHEVEQRIGACAINEREAELLKLAPGSIAIEVLRYYRLREGKVVEISRNLYPPHRFTFSLKLKRSSL